MRVIQRRRRARFALEAEEVFIRRRERGRQQLQGHVATELQIVRLIHLAHAARAERRANFEAADDLDPSGEWHDGATMSGAAWSEVPMSARPRARRPGSRSGGNPRGFYIRDSRLRRAGRNVHVQIDTLRQ
jgi:hypothetical protein